MGMAVSKSTFNTHNHNTSPLPCYYSVLKEYVDRAIRNLPHDSPHFRVYPGTQDNHFKVQLENEHISTSLSKGVHIKSLII